MILNQATQALFKLHAMTIMTNYDLNSLLLQYENEIAGKSRADKLFRYLKKEGFARPLKFIHSKRVSYVCTSKISNLLGSGNVHTPFSEVNPRPKEIHFYENKNELMAEICVMPEANLSLLRDGERIGTIDINKSSFTIMERLEKSGDGLLGKITFHSNKEILSEGEFRERFL